MYHFATLFNLPSHMYPCTVFTPMITLIIFIEKEDKEVTIIL